MADVKKTIEIIFAGTDNVSAAVARMGKNIEDVGSGFQDFGQPFADATTKILALNLAIAGLATAGIKASSDIETEATKMSNALGLPTAEAERFKQIATDVYSAGYGETLTSAFEAVTEAQRRFGDNAAVDIGKVTEQAFALQKTFGTDISESFSAVTTLMNNFGLTSEQAFNFVTKGFQDGLNNSNDFVDSINEYSTQFSSGGATAEQFFSVMSSGFQEGMLGTDRASDAFKEFRVRIQDGSKTTSDALKQIGLDDSFVDSIRTGEITAIDAFGKIITKLNDTENSSVQLQAGVGLIGTQFEDLGTQAALSIDTAAVSIDDFQDKINSIDTKTFAEKFKSLIRTITTEFGNLEEWEVAKEKLGAVFESIAEDFGEALKGVDFGGIEDAVEEVWNKVRDVFLRNDLDLTTVEGLQNAIQLVVDTMDTLVEITSGIIEIFGPLVDVVISVTEWFNSLSDTSKSAIGNILALGTGIGAIGTALAAGGAVLSGLAAFAGALTGPVLLAVGAVATALVGIKSYFDALIETEDENLDYWNNQSEALKKFGQAVAVLPQDTKVEVESIFYEQGVEAALDYLDQLPAEQKTTAVLDADEPSIAEAEKQINDGLESAREQQIKANIDMAEIEATSDEIQKAIEWEAKLDIEEAKANAETLQTSIEWEAKIDIATVEAALETINNKIEWDARINIAQLEADAEVSKEMFNSIGVSVAAVADSVASMFGSLADYSGVHFYELYDILQDQVDNEKALIDAQIALMQARTDAWNRGEGIQFQLNGDNISSGARTFMLEVMQEIQGVVSEQGDSLLLGDAEV